MKQEIQKEEDKPVFMRTLIKPEVHERLKEIAMMYKTGQGHWDFGVAIQYLLDFYDNSQLAHVHDKLDMIIMNMQGTQQTEEPQEEVKEIELLGGNKVRKNE